MSTAQQHRLIGQVIAERYRVDELLGEGGMGAVYIAQHLTLQKPVALKVVHPEHAGNADLAARFAREAMATSRIDHPNVISALDFGTLEDGRAYLAVQLVRGPSLSRVLAVEGRLSWARAAEIGAQIADALCAAQSHGIVHRDLKPDNVLLQPLDDGGELVKVLDFGVAKFMRDSLAPPGARTDLQVTQMGLVIGTPGYMAPEQAIGSPADARSDLYSLGVILWEAIVGRPLWGTTDDLQTLVENQLGQTAPRLREAAFDESIPQALDDLIASLLARRADERPADAGEVRDALREVRQLGGPDKPRWRSGARRVTPRTPSTLRVPVRKPEDFALIQPAPAPQESVPPTIGEPGAGQPTSRQHSTRPAWILTMVVTAILAGALVLVFTGQLQITPKGEVAAVAQQVAKRFNLPPPAEAQNVPNQVSISGLPLALEPVFQKLVAAEGRDDRSTAANALLSHVPVEEVPVYVRRMATLQLAQTCAAKKAEIEQLAGIGDPRALPLLVRISQRPRSGCGKRKRQDCLACLRAPLAALIDALEKKPLHGARTP